VSKARACALLQEKRRDGDDVDDSLADQQRWYDERRARNERAEDDRDRLIVALRAEVERLVDGLVREAGFARLRPGHHPPCPAMLDSEAVCTCGQ